LLENSFVEKACEKIIGKYLTHVLHFGSVLQNLQIFDLSFHHSISFYWVWHLLQK